MCGRYAANRDTGTLTEVFNIKTLPNETLVANFNISPTSKTYVITQNTKESRSLEIMTWGLIPSWAKDSSTSAKMINARFETVDEKPSFRSAFSKRRCIIPMDGYYEWFRPEDSKAKKQPYFIKAKNNPLLAVAGIYEYWKNPDSTSEEKEIHSFSIITTQALLGLATIHDRMPVLVPNRNWDAWLDTDLQNKDEVRSLIATPPNDYFDYYKIGTDVNNARNNGAELILPLVDI
jgi:putative SOS response-associated peptidase YedK